MQFFLLVVMPWVLSACTIAVNLMAGGKHRHTWALALIGQLGWTAWIAAAGEWGFVPMNVVLWVVYARNHMRWVGEKARTHAGWEKQWVAMVEEVSKRDASITAEEKNWWHPCMSCAKFVDHCCTAPRQFSDFSCQVPRQAEAKADPLVYPVIEFGNHGGKR